MQDLTSHSTWNIGQKVTFRFLFVYFLLYCFPFPFTIFEFIGFAEFSIIWDPIVVWAGEVVFDYNITIRPAGSGDTTWNYVQVFVFFVLSTFGTIVWSIVDRRRPNYDKLYFWLTVFVRYYLAVIMINYGMVKVIKTQFPFPHLGRLTGTYGDSSPMGLLWTFMGYSKAYNVFTGMAEILGGFLLFFRRTRLIGALVSIGVLSNVVMLNFSYDVPVKLFSLHLLACAMFLAAPDIKRLLSFFILNKPVSAEQVHVLFQRKEWQYAQIAVKVVFIGYVMISMIIGSLNSSKQWGDVAPKPPFYGIYEVEKHALNGDTLPPIEDHKVRWRRMTVNWKDWANVQYMDDASIAWRFAPDTLNHTLTITSTDSTAAYTFHYKLNERDRYELTGGDSTNAIYFELRKKDPNDFLLVSRGFNWINEYPYNR